jgi:hypothetical protein
MVAYRLVDLMGRASAANILGITVRELDKLVEVFELSEEFTKARIGGPGFVQQPLDLFHAAGAHLGAELAAGNRTSARMMPGEDIINGKPHPEPYLKTAQKLGVAPSNALV